MTGGAGARFADVEGVAALSGLGASPPQPATNQRIATPIALRTAIVDVQSKPVATVLALREEG